MPITHNWFSIGPSLFFVTPEAVAKPRLSGAYGAMVADGPPTERRVGPGSRCAWPG